MGWASARKECIRRADGKCAECGCSPGLVKRLRDRLRALRDPLYRLWRPGPRLMSYGVELATWYEKTIGWNAPTRSFGEVHHKKPRKEGGTDDQANLCYLCQRDHAQHTKTYAEERGDRGRRARRMKIGERKPGTVRIKLKMGQRKPRRW